MQVPYMPHLEQDGDKTSNDTNDSNNNGSSENAADLYGYGEGAPDSDKLVSSMNNLSTTEAARYGYEEHGDRGFGVNTTPEVCHKYDRTRVPRRSSLKMGGESTLAQRIQRRASMGNTNPNTGKTSPSSVATTFTVYPRGARKPVNRRRSIDFCETVHIKEVTPASEGADASELWLQPEDFAKMKLARRSVVQRHKERLHYEREHHDEMPVQEQPVDENEDIRGLERYIDKSGRELKNKAWDAVLIEQDEQELNGEFKPKRIAALYKSVSGATPEKAVLKGQQDHEAVQEYLMSPRTTKLMMRRLSC